MKPCSARAGVSTGFVEHAPLQCGALPHHEVAEEGDRNCYLRMSRRRAQKGKDEPGGAPKSALTKAMMIA